MDAAGRGTTLMTAICAFVAVIVIIQIWLVSAALEALLSEDRGVLLPAAAVSFALFLVNGGLLLHALRFDRTARSAAR